MPVRSSLPKRVGHGRSPCAFSAREKVGQRLSIVMNGRSWRRTPRERTRPRASCMTSTQRPSMVISPARSTRCSPIGSSRRRACMRVFALLTASLPSAQRLSKESCWDRFQSRRPFASSRLTVARNARRSLTRPFVVIPSAESLPLP
jgi:hypothetical protein